MSKADEIKDLGIEDDEIENTLKFIGIANDVCKEKGKIKYLDNTEEIEELDKNLKFDDLITPYGKNEDMMWTEIIKQHNKIDEIIRYIKRKDKNND